MGLRGEGRVLWNPCYRGRTWKVGEGGVRDVEEGTTGSLSAADEWAAMSHRIDAEPPPAPLPRSAARLRDASLPGLQLHLMAHI